MSQELAYVLITPYTISKSRTSGVLTRLLARTNLDLVAARMFAPSQELVEKYADLIISADDPQDKEVQEQIRQYILKNFRPDLKTGRRQRVMMLLFEGENAVQQVRQIVGHIRADRRTGESIRDTFGDYILDEHGHVSYFEPAVLAAPTLKEAREKLRLWTAYSESDGGLLENTIAYREGEVPERTLVLIKPENFQIHTGRPGNMIDYFSRTGLYIVAIKVHRMSVAAALEFYGPVRDVLRSKLKEFVANRAKEVLEKTLELKLTPETTKQVGELLGPLYGECQFESIIKFMSGSTPSDCPPEQLTRPGSQICIALVYEGVDAVRKIRDVLGPTDPSKAPPGSIRREFGQSVMVNAAHASDSTANAQREMKIINFGANHFKQVVLNFYGG